MRLSHRPLEPALARHGGRSALCFAFLALLAFDAGADVYRSVDPEGTVTYSDDPPPGHTDIERLEVPSTASPEAPSSLLDAQTDLDEWLFPDPEVESRADTLAVEVSILSPANDQALRSDDGSLTVEIAASPELRTGDFVEILVDGRPIARSESPVVLLQSVDRGTHVLLARILDPSGLEVAVSAPVTVHLLRHSSQHPRPSHPADNLPSLKP